MKRAGGRRNRYQCQKRYRHFQERISILVLFTTLEKKKKQATDKPYCLLHNNVIRKFSCFFLFQRFPKTTSLSRTVANSLVGGPTLTLTSLRTVANNSLLSVSFGSVGLAEAPRPTLASLQGTDFQSTPTRKKLVGTRRKNRKNLVVRSRNLLLARKQKNRLPQFFGNKQ